MEARHRLIDQAFQIRVGLAALIVGVAALVVLGVTMASPAQAEPNPYTAEGVCNSEAPGGGYYVQRSHELPGARVYQLYNGTHNCVVTIKTAHVGEPTTTNACVQIQDGSDWKCDLDEWEYYSGPVWDYGVGNCVRYFGYHGGDNFLSGWDNCG